MHHQSRATATAAIHRRRLSAFTSLAMASAASLIAGLTAPALREVIEALQQQNQALMGALARDAAGCKGRRT